MAEKTSENRDRLIVQAHALAFVRAKATGSSDEQARDLAVAFAMHMVETRNIGRLLAVPEGKRVAYLRASADNFGQDLRRAETRRGCRELSAATFTQHGNSTTSQDFPSNDSLAIKQEAAAAIELALGSLSVYQRDVFLRRADGQTSQEIAESLGKTDVAIRRCTADARRRLQGWLLRHGWSEPELRTAVSPPPRKHEPARLMIIGDCSQPRAVFLNCASHFVGCRRLCFSRSSSERARQAGLRS